MAEPVETPENTREDAAVAEQAEEKVMTRYQRYYQLHREQRLAKHKEAYENSPEVKAKREENERKRVEREEAKRLAKEERERKKQEKLQLALATRKPPKAT
jgi:hypothetical protein